jgi:hypothetical protein
VSGAVFRSASNICWLRSSRPVVVAGSARFVVSSFGLQACWRPVALPPSGGRHPLCSGHQRATAKATAKAKAPQRKKQKQQQSIAGDNFNGRDSALTSVPTVTEESWYRVSVQPDTRTRANRGVCKGKVSRNFKDTRKPQCSCGPETKHLTFRLPRVNGEDGSGSHVGTSGFVLPHSGRRNNCVAKRGCPSHSY